MPDLKITCSQCKEEFVFAEREQQKFYERNMTAPQLCYGCRSKKMAKREDAPKRYKIVCDHCGKQDSVPFQPKVGRSVLCKDCHQASLAKHR